MDYLAARYVISARVTTQGIMRVAADRLSTGGGIAAVQLRLPRLAANQQRADPAGHHATCRPVAQPVLALAPSPRQWNATMTAELDVDSAGACCPPATPPIVIQRPAGPVLSPPPSTVRADRWRRRPKYASYRSACRHRTRIDARNELAPWYTSAPRLGLSSAGRCGTGLTR